MPGEAERTGSAHLAEEMAQGKQDLLAFYNYLIGGGREDGLRHWKCSAIGREAMGKQLRRGEI